MKKLSVFLICIVLSMSFCFNAYADGELPETEETQSYVEEREEEAPSYVEETTQDASQPRLMVTSYKLSEKAISPNGKTTIEITMKNYSKTKQLNNIKLSLIDESGEIKCDGMPTAYVEKINANSTYTWKLDLIASKTAAVGEHNLSFNAEFEDKYYNSYSVSDVLSVTVTQVSSLDFDGVQLPVKVAQGDTQTVSVTLMNTGKAVLRNCKVDFAVDGFESAGTLFIGEIPAGESKEGSTNLRISNEVLGEVKGKATVSYEDELGEVFTKEVEVSSLIEKKVEVIEEEPEEEQAKYPMWWLFLAVGVIVGGAVGFLIPTIIRSNKQRKEDEMRL